jgi:hypothetical protein
MNFSGLVCPRETFFMFIIFLQCTVVEVFWIFLYLMFETENTSYFS